MSNRRSENIEKSKARIELIANRRKSRNIKRKSSENCERRIENETEIDTLAESRHE